MHSAIEMPTWPLRQRFDIHPFTLKIANHSMVYPSATTQKWMFKKSGRPRKTWQKQMSGRASETQRAYIPLFFSIGLSSVLSAAARSGVPGGTIKAKGGGRKSAMGHGKKTPQFLAHPNRSTPQALDYSDSSPTHLPLREMGFTETIIR